MLKRQPNAEGPTEAEAADPATYRFDTDEEFKTHEGDDDEAVPLVIGAGPVTNTITTPYKRRIMQKTVATEWIFCIPRTKEMFFLGASVRCGQNHEVQGFFCDAPISFEKDMLFSNVYKRRIKKLNERTCC